MILKTIDDVRRYTLEEAQRFPEISNEITLKAESLPFDSKVTTTLRLPHKYLAVAEANNLAGVSIGFFALWPSFADEPLDKSLLNSNAPDSPFHALTNQNLIAVARYDANLIYVGSAASSISDQVFWLDTMTFPKMKPKLIAKDFEQFLILAANLHNLSNLYVNDVEGGKKTMADCCDAFDCTAEQKAFWLNRAAEMLG